MANSTTETPEARARRLGWRHGWWDLWGVYPRMMPRLGHPEHRMLLIRRRDGMTFHFPDRNPLTGKTYPTLTAALDAIHGEEGERAAMVPQRLIDALELAVEGWIYGNDSYGHAGAALSETAKAVCDAAKSGRATTPTPANPRPQKGADR